MRKFWLMKSEPEAFSIEDLGKAKKQTASWDGVRNYQARNFLRDQIKTGDGVLFYHSNANPSGIAGEAVVVRGGYPDHTAWDPENVHFDPKSSPDKPIWYMVDVKLVRKCARFIPLEMLKKTPGLEDMLLFRASQLSVQPVTKREWDIILKLPGWK